MHAEGDPRRTRHRLRSPSRAAIAALMVGGVALVAAACQPVTAPPPPPQPVSQYCAATAPVTAAGYQADFNSLRAAYTEWASADGAIPVTLPDGRTVWMFGDTFVGKVDPGGAIDSADPLVHNSFVLQTGSCFQPLMGGAPLARSALIPNPTADQFYWPASAVVDGTTLVVFCWHMQQTGAGLNFQTLGMSMATFALPSLHLQGVQALPIPFSTTAAPGTNAAVPYGATALANTGPGGDGDVYLYGSSDENAYVARAPLAQILTSPSVWQFYAGTPTDPSNWSTDPTAAQPMTWANFTPAFFLGAAGQPNEAPFAQPWVLPYKTGPDQYLATAKSADAFSTDVSVFAAPDPWGPFTYQSSPVSDAPYTTTQVSYGAFSLNPVSADPIIVYSTNINSLEQAAGVAQPPYSIQEYGPVFVAPESPLP